MPNIKLKKALALLLSISMLATSFVGCSSSDDDAETSASTDTSTSTDTSADDDDAEPEEFTYPMSYDGEQITIFANGFFDLNSEYNTAEESQFHNLCEEYTGLDLEWDFVPAGTDATTYKNLIISGSSFPTIISGTSVSDTDSLISDGVIVDLSELLADWAPNYWAAMEENEYYKKSLTSDTGNMGGLGSWRESTFGAVFQGLMIREDLLIEQGLDMPETIDDWTEIMAVMKEEYNMTFSVEIGTSTPMFASGFGSYGTYGLAKAVVDGEVILAQNEPEWYDYMLQMNEWYEAGYIDPDFITIDDATLQAKVYNNEVFATFEALSRITLFDTYATDNETGAIWTACQNPAEEEGGVACTGFQQDVVRYNMVSISTSASIEQTEYALRFLDWFMTDEGSYFQNYGDEGDTHTWDDDGTLVWADYITEDPTGYRTALSKYTGASGICIGAQLTGLVVGINSQAGVDAVYIWMDNNDASDHIFPSVTYTDDEQYELDNITSALTTYINEMCIAFIIGTADIETDYDAFMYDLENTYNVSRYLEINQDAYDRFLAR